MIISKKDNVYTITHSEIMEKSLPYFDFVKLMCGGDTQIFKNRGVYVFMDGNDAAEFGEVNALLVRQLVNKRNDAEIYFRISDGENILFVTSTDYMDINGHYRFVWKPFRHKNIPCGCLEHLVIVEKNKELYDYTAVIKFDEDHEQDMELIHIKVRDEDWFENTIVPKLREKLGEVEIDEA